MLLVAGQLPYHLPIVVLSPMLNIQGSKPYNIEFLGSYNTFEVLGEDLMKLKVAEGLLFIANFAVDDNVPGIPILQEYLLLFQYAEAHKLLLSGLKDCCDADSLLFSN